MSSKDTVKEKKNAIKLLGTKDVTYFETKTPERNDIKGWKVQTHNFKLGSMLITEINGKDTIDFVQSMPKISYGEGLSGDENIFNSTIQSRFGLKYKDINLLNKEDGCLRYDTEILFYDGSRMPVKKIVENKITKDVSSYNLKNGVVEPKKIVGWNVKSYNGDWYSIQLNGGKFGTFTEDHPIFTNDGWKKAMELETCDKILIIKPNISEKQKYVIYGILLGDGHISGKNVMWSQKNSGNHGKYLDYIKTIFNNLPLSARNITGGFGSERTQIRLGIYYVKSKYFDVFKEIRENVKFINQKWLKNLNEISLAFWYMDDGCLSTIKSKYKTGYQAILSTEGFNEKEIDLLISFLKVRFGIIARKGKSKKNMFLIRISQNHSAKFFNLISKYVHPAMRYKLPIENQKIDFIPIVNNLKWDVDWTKIQKIVIHKQGKNKYSSNKRHRYAITIEGNHNYFAPYMLVKNTNIIFYPLRLDGEILEIIPKTRGMPVAESEFLRQSEEISDKNVNYKKFVKDNNLVLSCEMYGSRNPNEVNYDYWKIELNLDAICVLDWGLVLPYSKMVSMIKSTGLPLIMKNFMIENNIAVPTEPFKKRYSEFLPDEITIPFVSLQDLYNKLEIYYEAINTKYKEMTKSTGIIVEGSCWHAETSKDTRLVKNKAVTVKETHMRVSAGIPDMMIRHACRRAYEDIGLEAFKTDKGFNEMLSQLKEDMPDQLVKDFPKYQAKLRRVYEDFIANMTSVEEIKVIVDKLVEDFKEDYNRKNMAPILREFAKKYPHLRPKSTLVFKILTKQV
jgi:hypothetical protein